MQIEFPFCCSFSLSSTARLSCARVAAALQHHNKSLREFLVNNSVSFAMRKYKFVPRRNFIFVSESNVDTNSVSALFGRSTENTELKIKILSSIWIELPPLARVLVLSETIRSSEKKHGSVKFDDESNRAKRRRVIKEQIQLKIPENIQLTEPP